MPVAINSLLNLLEDRRLGTETVFKLMFTKSSIALVSLLEEKQIHIIS